MTVLNVTPPVRALVRKELREYRHHRMIVLTATILPIAFLFLPVVNLVLYDADRAIGGVDFAVGQAMFCFFLTPVIIPATMAAYSIIGERDQGTLEPMLTLPMEDSEFLKGKVLAIVLPAVGATWVIFGAYLVIVYTTVGDPVRDAALAPTWMFAMLLMAPLMALFSSLTGMLFSARSKDVRVAEHLSGLVLLPSMFPILLVVTNAIPASILTWCLLGTVVGAIDFGLWRVALRAFNRERAISTV